VVEERVLSTVLSEFARTLVTDFPIQAILDHLVQRIVGVLPVTSAGVTLIDRGRDPHYIAASDGAALRFEQLQSELGQGPCLLACSSQRPVAIADLALDAVFPVFSPAAVAAGCAAVFTFPLRHPAGCLGALDLYRDTPGDLSDEDTEAAQTLADVTAAYLLNAQAREDAARAAVYHEHTSTHDALTGLANRRLLHERLIHAAARATRNHSTSVVVFCDLDRFKQINDVHGHQAGDELLLAVAHRLSGLVRPGDTLARVSGDEFVFLCEGLTGVDDVHRVADRVDAAFGHPFVLGGITLSVTASVGVAHSGPGEELTEVLIHRADAAMYEAKRLGGANHQVVDLGTGVQTHDRATLEQDLRRAVDHRELSVLYHPVVALTDGAVVGVEALLRWTHPTRGPVPTAVVVEIAESTGLIGDIGAWVLEQACADHARWASTHPGTALEVAVNVSTHQLVHPDFPRLVADVLRRTGTDPGQVVLELTDSDVVDDGDRVLIALTALKALGPRLALDDFGTGCSSLSHLRRLPVDIVKIDQGFVADLDDTPAGTAIIDAVTTLGHVLGMAVVAEGVETTDQHRQVKAVGCDLAQGHLYARPLTATEIDERLTEASPGPWRVAGDAAAVA
jgi:diguanylate cyclase (GGDEF)-like protein